MKARYANHAAALLALLLLLTSCASADSVATEGETFSETGTGSLTETLQEGIALTVAGQVLTVEWADNSTVDALRELLKKGDVTLDMSDYAGFEKGAPLPETLPQNNEPMNTDAGDIILYQGRQFVIYYDKNSWSLTPLGKITGMTKAELQALLGTGNVTAALSLVAKTSGVE